MKCKASTSIIFIIFIGAIAYNIIALAAIDAPHNESNNVSCGSCHGQGLLNSPFWGGSMSYDQLCLNCHTASSGPYTETNAPLVKTHSSENTSEQYGVWSRECRNCHDAHYQKQKTYKNTDAENLYLATGIIDSCAYNDVANKSTLTYTSINYKTGWDATKITEKTDQFRRTILFPNVSKLGYSYPVVAIDTPLPNSIVVSGDARPVYQYITESTFAIMYGQYVRDIVNDKTVKFLDQTGSSSFADGDLTYNGVCEVCHTLTDHFRNDGSGGDQNHANVGGAGGTNCIACHKHIDGFGHSTGGGTGCEECHGQDGGAGTTQSHSTHMESDDDDLKGPDIFCADCHDTTNYPTFADGATSLNDTTVCDSCHSSGGSYDGVAMAKAGWENGVYENNGRDIKSGHEKWCASCHDNDPAYSKSIYSELIVDNPSAEFLCSLDHDDPGWGVTNLYPGHYYGDDYRYHRTALGTNCTATWVPDLPQSGNYSVYASWTSNDYRADHVPYTINYDGGSDTVWVDQWEDFRERGENGGDWVLLGTYYFSAGTSGSVVLNASNAYHSLADPPTNDHGGGYWVSADAVYFIKSKTGDTETEGVYAPNVVGDNSTYGHYVTGHKLDCLSCHDTEKPHIDHEHRTYSAALDNYTYGYRLKYFMNVPSDGLSGERDAALCIRCHNYVEILEADLIHTNFVDLDPSDQPTQWKNLHRLHHGIGGTSSHFDSDYNGTGDSNPTCITCHNVHGAPNSAMIRHGELISTPGTSDKVPALDFTYTVPYDQIYTATYPAPIGTFDVYAWWLQYTARANNVLYTINHSSGTDTDRKDQQTNGDQWNRIGAATYTFGTGDTVVISNEGVTGGAYASIVADAIGFDSDFDGTPDIIVENTDASFSPEWNLAPDRGYLNSDLRYITRSTDPYASLNDTKGGDMLYVGSMGANHVCNDCHGGEFYGRDNPNLGPKVLDHAAIPDNLPPDGITKALLTARVIDPNNDPDGHVTINLLSIGGSATQTMYDDGTNGDVTADDDIYSVEVTVPTTVSAGMKTFTVTATDAGAFSSSTGDIRLDVLIPGSVVVDNPDATFDPDCSFGCDSSGPTGKWAYAAGGNGVGILEYGDDLRVKQCGNTAGYGNATAVWRPNVPQTGQYNVYAWWLDASEKWRSHDVTYTINHSVGSDDVVVDQTDLGPGGGKWIFLGTYSFNAGTSGYIVLSDYCTPTSIPGGLTNVIADAIKLEPFYIPQQVSGGNYYKEITIHSSQVEEDLTYFPMLFHTTDSDLKTTTNGGHVENDNGHDIVFAGLNGLQLPHEIEKYDGSTGELVVWVRIPSLSSTTDTVIRIYYGDSSVTTSQENPTGIWSYYYTGVWHLPEDPSGVAPQIKDSTYNNNHGTASGSMIADDQVDGKIGGALDFDGDDEFIDVSDSDSLEPQNLTVSVWVNMNGAGSNSDGNMILAKERANVEPYMSYHFEHNDDTNQFSFRVGFTDDTRIDIYSPATYDETVSAWYHLVGTYDGSVVTFYIDGEYIDSTGKVGTIKYGSWGGGAPSYGIPAQDFTIGMWGYSFDYRRAFKGIIDEVRISNTARSAGWIKTSYNNQSSPATFYSVGPEQASGS